MIFRCKSLQQKFYSFSYLESKLLSIVGYVADSIDGVFKDSSIYVVLNKAFMNTVGDLVFLELIKGLHAVLA